MEFWYVLGIGPTKNTDEIRAAYKAKLKVNHPEDNPEGFKALREAYDKAIEYAENEQEEKQFEDSPLGRWEKKLDDIYSDYLRRIRNECWEELLDDDVMICLDTRETAEHKLLEYMMQHHLVPQGIWKLIVEKLEIKDNKKDYLERFPEDFLDYIINNATYPDNFNYSLFEQWDSSLPYEEYIKLYFKFKAAVAEHREEEAKSLQVAIEDMPLTHPYYNIARINLLVWSEQLSEAADLAQELYDEYSDDAECCLCYAGVLYSSEQYKEALEIYQSVEKTGGSEYASKCGQADCLYGMEEYKAAQKIYKELLMVRHYDGYVHYRLTLCNDALISKYENDIKEDENNVSSRIELCWCYYQNNRMDEAFELVDGRETEGNLELDLRYLKGRCLYNLNRYEEAVYWFGKWQELFPEYEDTPGEEGKRNRDRRELVYYFLAEISIHQEEYAAALAYNDEAMKFLNVDKDLIITQRGIIYKKLREFEKAEETLQQALDIGYDNVQAMICLADIYREMGRLQSAVGYYERAIYTLPFIPEGYAKLLKLYIDEEVYEMADDLLKQFRTGEITSAAVDYCEALLMSGKGEYDKAAEIIKKTEQEIKDDRDNDLPLIATADEFEFEKINIFLDADIYENRDAIPEMKKLIDKNPDNVNYLYFTAKLYSRVNEEKTALKYLRKSLKLRPDNETIISAMAESYRVLGSEEEKKYLNKLLELNPEHLYAHGRLGDFYEVRKIYERARMCYDRQLEINPTSYYYISRGIVYMEMFEGEYALRDFEAAVAMNDDNPYAFYNLGRQLMRMDRVEEAVAPLEKAVELSKGTNNRVIFNQLARCYARLRDRKEDYLEKLDMLYATVREALPRHSYYLEGRIKRSLGQWQEAIEAFEKAAEIDTYASDEMYAEAIETYLDYTGDSDKVKKMLAKRKAKGRQEFYIWVEFNLYRYLGAAGNEYKLYDKKPPRDEADYYHRALCCKKLSVTKSATKAVKNGLMDQYEDNLDKAERYSLQGRNNASDAKQCYRRLAMIALERGDIQAAEKYMEDMAAAPVCDYCLTSKCYEYYTCKAMLAKAKGQKEEALYYVEIAQNLCLEDLDIGRLKQEIEKM